MIETLEKNETSQKPKPGIATLQVGVDSFAARGEDESAGISPSESIRNLVRRIELAD